MKSKTRRYRELLERIGRELILNSNMEDVLYGNRVELTCYNGRKVNDLLLKFREIKNDCH